MRLAIDAAADGPIDRECRHFSSAVEQLFRKSPALCAVLPRVETPYKQAYSSTIRFYELATLERGSTTAYISGQSRQPSLIIAGCPGFCSATSLLRDQARGCFLAVEDRLFLMLTG